jgi:2-polyprenyl-3-methyl-5-hydroxy-6-metoxy-1,4-benzoquinol methylase
MCAATSLRLFSPPQFRQQQPVPVESGPVELETVDCLLCGGSEQETVIVAADALTRIGGNFRVVRCRDCRLAFTNPRPTARSLGQFYPADYAPHWKREADGQPRGRLRRSLEFALLRRHYDYPPQPAGGLTAITSAFARVVIRRTRAREHWIPFRAPGRLLDFGCGSGEFMKQMRDYGWNVEGLDLSPGIVEALRERGIFRTHLGTLPHPDIPAAAFDAITMWHSLEHVPDPRDVLRAATDALRAGGVLAVSVPNFASWSFRQFQDHWTGLGLPRHLTHFTPQTLCHMVESTGLRVLSIAQVGRDGFIRKSANRAVQAHWGPTRFRILRWKGLASLVARWTELTFQADTVRLIAEKV